MEDLSLVCALRLGIQSLRVHLLNARRVGRTPEAVSLYSKGGGVPSVRWLVSVSPLLEICTLALLAQHYFVLVLPL